MLLRSAARSLPRQPLVPAGFRRASTNKGDDDKIVIPWATVSFTAMVLVGYYAFFHLVEKPHLDRTEPGWDKKSAPLAHDVSQVLPDGRLLMSDGSIRGKP